MVMMMIIVITAELRTDVVWQFITVIFLASAVTSLFLAESNSMVWLILDCLLRVQNGVCCLSCFVVLLFILERKTKDFLSLNAWRFGIPSYFEVSFSILFTATIFFLGWWLSVFPTCSVIGYCSSVCVCVLKQSCNAMCYQIEFAGRPVYVSRKSDC